jgi:hypothetical protein
MAVNTVPIFPGGLVVGLAQLTVANTNRDGTGTLVDVVTSVAEGIRIDRIVICFTVTSTAGVIRLFLYDGTNNRLIDEILISAITPSTTVKVAYYDYVRADGKPIAWLAPDATWKLKAATHNAEASNIVAYGGKYTA